MLRKSCVILAATAFIGFAGTMSAQAGGDLALEPVDRWSGLSVWLGGGATDIDTSVWGDFDRKDVLRKRQCEKIKVSTTYWPYYKYVVKCTEPIYKKNHLHKEVHADEGDWEWFGTAGIGYDRRVGGGIGNGIYVGAFLDYDFYPDSDHNFSHVVKKYGKDVFKAHGDVGVDGVLNVGLRAGAAFNNSLMVYILAAWSQMKIDGNLTVEAKDPFPWVKHWGGPVSNTKASYKVDDDLDGWIVGLGAKWMCADNISLGFEYRYGFDYDSTSASISKKSHTTGSKCTSYGKHGCMAWKENERWIKQSSKAILDVDDTHSVRAVLTLHMGTPHRAAPAPLK